MKRFILLVMLLVAYGSAAHDTPSPIIDATAATTLTAGQQRGGVTVYMSYTTAEQIITLADVEPGMYVCFKNYAGQFRKTIQPASGDKIVLDGRDLGTDGGITSKTDIGEEVCLKGLDGTTWASEGNNNFSDFILETAINYEIHSETVVLTSADGDGFKRIVTTAGSGDIEFDLPTSPSAGDQFRFIQMGTGTITIDPATGDTILGNAGGSGALSSGDAITSGDKKISTIVLEYVDANTIVVLSFHGPWRTP